MKLSLSTSFTKKFNCELPVIGAPMFLVSNTEMVSEISLAGGVGTFPTLNCKSPQELEDWVKVIKSRVLKKTFGVNLIVHKSNLRYKEDKSVILKHRVPLIISSLGDPTELIKEASDCGVQVLCDVVSLKHGEKAVKAGASGLIVVGAGAGGHAGKLSPFAALPWFKKHFPNTLIVAAGAIASGQSLAASLALGADAASVGTRFIASQEAQVSQAYKQAILNAGPEDIFMSSALSGVPASILKTKENMDFYKWDRSLKGKVQQLLTYGLLKRGLKLKKSYSWKNVWSAGQSVGEIDKVMSCKEILKEFEQVFF